MNRFLPLCVLLCIALPAPLLDAGQAAPSFAFANLDFETDADGDGWPDGWADQAGGQAGRVEIINGDYVLRICVLSFRTHLASMEAALEDICEVAEELRADRRRGP